MICLYAHGLYQLLSISEPGFGMDVCGCSVADRKCHTGKSRYGSEDFNNIDHADNNLANGFLGFLVLAVIIVLIAK